MRAGPNDIGAGRSFCVPTDGCGENAVIAQQRNSASGRATYCREMIFWRTWRADPDVLAAAGELLGCVAPHLAYPMAGTIAGGKRCVLGCSSRWPDTKMSTASL